MSDYLAPTAGLEGDWSGSSGTAGNTTLAVGTDVAIVVLAGYNFTNDTMTLTLEGNAPDVIFRGVGGAGDGCVIAAWANPTTGSSIAIAFAGMDGGDSGCWFSAGVSNADATEIAATGFPDTGTDGNSNPSITLTTVADDLGWIGAAAFSTGSGDVWTQGAGETEVAERWETVSDDHCYIGYEKATGVSVTLAPTSTAGNDIAIAVVIPTAAVGGVAVLPGAVTAGVA